MILRTLLLATYKYTQTLRFIAQKIVLKMRDLTPNT